ncbi:MAG: succinylglutamate desuccinylase/aspartoacylase family protein [Lysobacterales bacterium]
MRAGYVLALCLGFGAVAAQDFPAEAENPAKAVVEADRSTTAEVQPKAATTPPPASVPVPQPAKPIQPTTPESATPAVAKSRVRHADDSLAAAGGSEIPLIPATEVSPFIDALEPVPTEVLPMALLGELVQPGSRQELRWASSQSFDGAVVATPVIVLHGNRPGPRLCLVAAVHGDELNGIEIIRRVANELDVGALAGSVIAVPIMNYLGYSRGTRYLPDRRDLNRYFPGRQNGSSASRIAYSFFNDVARHCHALVDFHTGSFDRGNLPQVRGDLRIPAVLSFTRGFGATAVLHSPGSPGMLRRALTDAGIPAVTFELGAPQRLEPTEIDFGVQAVHTLLHKLGMTTRFRLRVEPQALFYAARWVRADTGGMLFAEVELGDYVRKGQRLGKIIDPLQNLEQPVLAPVRGKIIGMALNQIVLPGFALFHIGVQTSEQRLAEEAAAAAVDAVPASTVPEEDGDDNPQEAAEVADEDESER